MAGNRAVALLVLGGLLAGCTSDPDAAVNQATPIRQMDRFFNSLSSPGPSHGASDYRERDYTHAPGYAPAYPAYSAY